MESVGNIVYVSIHVCTYMMWSMCDCYYVEAHVGKQSYLLCSVCVVLVKLVSTSLPFLDVGVGGCAVLKRDERYIFYLVSRCIVYGS